MQPHEFFEKPLHTDGTIPSEILVLPEIKGEEDEKAIKTALLAEYVALLQIAKVFSVLACAVLGIALASSLFRAAFEAGVILSMLFR